MHCFPHTFSIPLQRIGHQYDVSQSNSLLTSCYPYNVIQTSMLYSRLQYTLVVLWCKWAGWVLPADVWVYMDIYSFEEEELGWVMTPRLKTFWQLISICLLSFVRPNNHLFVRITYQLMEARCNHHHQKISPPVDPLTLSFLKHDVLTMKSLHKFIQTPRISDGEQRITSILT